MGTPSSKSSSMPHQPSHRGSSSTTSRSLTPRKPTLPRPKRLCSKEKRPRNFSKQQTSPTQTKLRPRASSSSWESRALFKTARKSQRTTSRVTRLTAPAASTSPIEKREAKSWMSSGNMLLTSRRGKHSSTHGLTCLAQRSEIIQLSAGTEVTVLYLYDGLEPSDCFTNICFKS